MNNSESHSKDAPTRQLPQRRAYLDSLGPDYEPSTTWTNAPDGKEDERQRRWNAQQKRYGFDSRQTWSLDSAMVELLYERLQAYLILADQQINLEFHSVEFEGETLNQKEAIMKLLGYCREVLVPSYDDEDFQEERAAKQLWNLWAVLHPYMWW